MKQVRKTPPGCHLAMFLQAEKNEASEENSAGLPSCQIPVGGENWGK